MQRLLNASRWDAGALRDNPVASVRGHLANPAAVQVINETRFLKKGTKSAGVKRQYSGTAGKRENCQIGVFVTYPSLVLALTQVLIDRNLYRPEEWASDFARRREAGIPDEVTFATKPELARRMLERVRAAGLPAAWVTGDAVYGGSGLLRAWLEEQRHAYVLAIAANDGVDLPDGPGGCDIPVHVLPEEIAAHALDPHDWHCVAAGDGSKEPHLSGRAFVSLAPPTTAGFEQALLIRRPSRAATRLMTPRTWPTTRPSPHWARSSRRSWRSPGVCWRVKPSARTTPLGCSRPHWAMAYRLRAPHSIATVASTRTAGKGWRRPCRERGSGTAASARSKLGPSSAVCVPRVYQIHLIMKRHWAILAPLVPAVKPGGRPACHSRREVVNAILYVVRGGIQWRAMPHDLSPWQTA
jgi:hypothetical protein